MLYDIRTPLDVLEDNYNPDPLEWRNDVLASRSVLAKEVPKYEELVKIQKALDDFIKNN